MTTPTSNELSSPMTISSPEPSPSKTRITRLPLFWLSLAFLVGVPAAANGRIPGWGWAATAVVLLGIGILLSWLKKRSEKSRESSIIGRLGAALGVPLWALMIAASLGALRYQASLPNLENPRFIANYRDDGQIYSVTGVLIKPPDVRDAYTNLWVKTEQIRPKGKLTHEVIEGLLLVRTSELDDLRYGDEVVVQGKIQTPSEGGEDFSYRKYLFHKGVYVSMTYASVGVLGNRKGNPIMRNLTDFKAKALKKVYGLWSDPEASLFAGILLGVESGIPKNVADAFKATGTTHIIAISGFNITIIAGLLIGLFGRFMQRYWAALAAAIGIALYTLLVGADAAVVRAAIMGGFSLIAVQIGRRQHGLNSLAIVAALMALLDPHVLWDVGFQLSFAATLGLVLYAQPLQDWFVRLASKHMPQNTAQKLAQPVGEYILFTLAAQVTTLPILAFHFQRLSLSSVLVNPLILPAQPPLMILGGIALLLSMVFLPLGRILAPFAWVFAGYTIRVVEAFAPLPGGIMILGSIGLGFVLFYYMVIFGITAYWERFTAYVKRFRDESWGERLALPALAGLGIAAVVLWRGAQLAPDGVLHLTLFNVGTGHALLIQSPNGRRVLIDGGPSPSRLSDALGRRLPPFTRSIDYLVIASPDEGNIAALPSIIERYPPGEVLWAGYPSINRSADRMRKTLKDIQVPILHAQDGHRLDLGGGVGIRVVRVNNRGAILMVEMGSFRAFLPLGITLEDMQALEMGRQIGEVSALLLAESGYAPANPPEWIDNLRPQVVLLSVAPDDPDGLPDAETLDAVSGYTLLRTDRNGWIHITTDGEQMWVEAERR